MHKLPLILLVFISFINLNAQNKKDWYLLSETGFNQVNGNNKIHFGVGAEYFISDSKSFTFRLKYFKNGIDFSKEGTSCNSFFCLFSSSSKRFLYEGSILKIPINYEWEKALFSSKLKFFFTTGIALNFTLKDYFIEVKGLTPNKNTTNLNLNFGVGFLYKINNNVDLFYATEIYSGSPKTKEKVGFIFGSRLRTEETLFNFGIRYRLK